MFDINWIYVGKILFTKLQITACLQSLSLTHTQTHSVCHSWLLLKMIHCLTVSLCVPLHPSMGLCAGLYVGWMVGGCSSCWYVCLVRRIMTISLIAKCLGLSLHTCCVWVYVCMSVCVRATCMSKQLSQIYSLAQVSACYLAHVQPVWLCVCVCVCVCDTERVCSQWKHPGDLSEEPLLLKHSAVWLTLCVWESQWDREADHIWHLLKCNIMLMICLSFYIQHLRLPTTHS